MPRSERETLQRLRRQLQKKADQSPKSLVGTLWHNCQSSFLYEAAHAQGTKLLLIQRFSDQIKADHIWVRASDLLCEYSQFTCFGQAEDYAWMAEGAFVVIKRTTPAFGMLPSSAYRGAIFSIESFTPSGMYLEEWARRFPDEPFRRRIGQSVRYHLEWEILKHLSHPSDRMIHAVQPSFQAVAAEAALIAEEGIAPAEAILDPERSSKDGGSEETTRGSSIWDQLEDSDETLGGCCDDFGP